MSHHSSEWNPHRRQMAEAMKELFGEYPHGRLNDNDAGALAVTVGQENGKVVINFPKPVAWVGFTGDQAMEIAAALMKHARAVGITKPVSLII